MLPKFPDTVTDDAVGVLQGDSGGPYACPQDGVWVLAGLVSWGRDCGATHQPGVYTSVTFHLPWIYDVITQYDRLLAALAGL